MPTKTKPAVEKPPELDPKYAGFRVLHYTACSDVPDEATAIARAKAEFAFYGDGIAVDRLRVDRGVYLICTGHGESYRISAPATVEAYREWMHSGRECVDSSNPSYKEVE
jgi:hypothetical protein